MKCACCELGPEAADARIVELVQSNGFAVVPVLTDPPEPNFTYSIGMQRTFGIPEFLLVGDFHPTVLIAVAEGIRRVAQADPEVFRRGGEVPGVIQLAEAGPGEGARDAMVGFMALPPECLTADAARPLTAARRFYGDEPFTACQLVLPDAEGRLPWHPGFDEKWGRESGQRLLYAH